MKTPSIPLSSKPEATRALAIKSCSPRFLTPDEAAEFMGGLNSRTVTRWAREAYLPAVPVGEGKRRLWRFREADLEAWMLSRRTGLTESQLASGKLIAAADAPFGGNSQ